MLAASPSTNRAYPTDRYDAPPTKEYERASCVSPQYVVQAALASAAGLLVSRIVVASGSKLSAEAGAQIADEGGNAVDAAIAASIVLMTSEHGVCAPGAGGFITIRTPGEPPVTIDANVTMPGRGVDPDRFGTYSRQVTMAYGGEVTTIVGYESVATPGGIAGLGVASERSGVLPWRELVAPAEALARAGVPLSDSSHLYLTYSHEAIFGWHSISRRALHDEDGNLFTPGTIIEVPHLSDTLAELGEKGWQDLYRGDLAKALADDLEAGGSLVSREDLASVEPVIRPALEVALGDWRIFTSPPPSIGGVTLGAMLELVASINGKSASIDQLIGSQGAILRYRRDFLDHAEDLDRETKLLLDKMASGFGLEWMTAPSTVHASAVSDDGAACSITMSAGYGSGVVGGSTGMWMNNSLGEAELNRGGFHGLPIGTVLPSNMAPSIGVRDDGAVLSVGSPGADRITTALQQVIAAIVAGRSPQHAVDAPRLHVEPRGDVVTIAYEAGIDIPNGYHTRQFSSAHMFFGGVAVAMHDPQRGLLGAADRRRAGAVAIGGSNGSQLE